MKDSVRIQQGKNTGRPLIQLRNPVDVATNEYCTAKADYQPSVDGENLADKLTSASDSASKMLTFALHELGGVSETLSKLKSDITSTQASRCLKCDDFLSGVKTRFDTHIETIRKSIQQENEKANAETFFQQNRGELSQLDIAMIDKIDFSDKEFSLSKFAYENTAQARVALSVQEFTFLGHDVGFNSLIALVNERFSPDAHNRLKELRSLTDKLDDFCFDTVNRLDKLTMNSGVIRKIKDSKVH